jgi:hypothetical protein
MPFRITVHHAATHLAIACEGPAALGDLCGAIDLASGLAARQGYRLAVLDLLGVEVDLGFTDHLQLGTYAAERLGALARVASVVPARYRTGISEKAAQKSGLHLRTFADVDEALRWVLAAPLTPPAPAHP